MNHFIASFLVSFYGFEYFSPPLEKWGVEQSFNYGIPGSSCTSLVVKGAFKSIFAFLIPLEGEVATQSPSGICQ